MTNKHGKRPDELLAEIMEAFTNPELNDNAYTGNTRDRGATVYEEGDWIMFTVSQMYEYLPMNLRIMTRLAEIIGTDKLKFDQDSSSGCETCDYGSSYSHNIAVRKEHFYEK